jgi:superfamily I DNA and/or RNA helicase
MNVAITRAKELLVVVGNADLLSRRDPYWKGFLQFALRHNLFVFSLLSYFSDRTSDSLFSLVTKDLNFSLRKTGTLFRNWSW